MSNNDDSEAEDGSTEDEERPAKRRKLATSLPKTNVHGPWFRRVIHLAGGKESSIATDLFYQAPSITQQSAGVAARFYRRMVLTLEEASHAIEGIVDEREADLCADCAADSHVGDAYILEPEPCLCRVANANDKRESKCGHGLHSQHLPAAVGVVLQHHLFSDLALVVLEYLDLCD